LRIKSLRYLKSVHAVDQNTFSEAAVSMAPNPMFGIPSVAQRISERGTCEAMPKAIVRAGPRAVAPLSFRPKTWEQMFSLLSDTGSKEEALMSEPIDNKPS
jgi:hypothetical protein